MTTRPTARLQPHPRNAAIYGDDADAELVESVREHGILVPLLITDDDRIIAGHRRWSAAGVVGLGEVPVVVFGSDDEVDILEAILESNRQRVKTNDQCAREFVAQKEIEAVPAADRKRKHAGTAPGKPKTLGPNLAQVSGKASQKAAAAMGKKRVTMEKAAEVVRVIDILALDGEDAQAEELLTLLNDKSVDAAYRKVRSDGLTTAGHAEQAVLSEATLLTLSTWRTLSPGEQREALRRPADDSQLNGQSTTKIQWAQWSWNPVTGCKHDCSYCYARDIAQGHTRIAAYPQGFEPTFLPQRLGAPAKTPVPAAAAQDVGYKNVFTCSMADLFGRWVPQEWIEAVLAVVRANPQWNFLFLTKFAQRLAEFDFPANAWVGTTIDAQARVANAERAFARVRAPVKWLSIEPLLEPIRFEHPEYFDWWAIGGASASTQTPEWHPPLAWVADLERQARHAGVRVYHKANLYAPLHEYPGSAMGVPLNVADAFKMPYLQRDVLEPEAYAAEVQP